MQAYIRCATTPRKGYQSISRFSVWAGVDFSSCTESVPS
jgi:hypothetical protein